MNNELPAAITRLAAVCIAHPTYLQAAGKRVWSGIKEGIAADLGDERNVTRFEMRLAEKAREAVLDGCTELPNDCFFDVNGRQQTAPLTPVSWDDRIYLMNRYQEAHGDLAQVSVQDVMSWFRDRPDQPMPSLDVDRAIDRALEPSFVAGRMLVEVLRSVPTSQPTEKWFETGVLIFLPCGLELSLDSLGITEEMISAAGDLGVKSFGSRSGMLDRTCSWSKEQREQRIGALASLATEKLEVALSAIPDELPPPRENRRRSPDQVRHAVMLAVAYANEHPTLSAKHVAEHAELTPSQLSKHELWKAHQEQKRNAAAAQRVKTARDARTGEIQFYTDEKEEA